MAGPLNDNNSISIFAYDDYRRYLADSYLEQKQASPRKISYRYLSRKAGFKTRSFIPYVIQGKRNLTLESIDKVAQAFSLKGRPYQYFKTLVLFNQATCDEEKTQYYESMKEYKEYVQVRLLNQDQRAYMLKWYYPVIREMVRWPDFEPRASWIAAKIRPKILVSQAEEAMDVLVKLKLVQVLDDGTWHLAHPKIKTPDQETGRELHSYYEKAILLGRESLKLPKEERNLSSTTLSMSPALFELLRRKIHLFHQEINGLLSQPVTKDILREYSVDEKLIQEPGFFDVGEVGQLNVQFFKVAKARGLYE